MGAVLLSFSHVVDIDGGETAWTGEPTRSGTVELDDFKSILVLTRVDAMFKDVCEDGIDCGRLVRKWELEVMSEESPCFLLCGFRETCDTYNYSHGVPRLQFDREKFSNRWSRYSQPFTCHPMPKDRRLSRF